MRMTSEPEPHVPASLPPEPTPAPLPGWTMEAGKTVLAGMRQRTRSTFLALAGTLLLLFASCAARGVPDLPLMNSESMPAAVGHAYAAAKSQPSDAGVVHRLGMVLQAHGQNTAAAQAYSRVHALDPKRYETLYLWAQTLSANGEHKSAVTRLQEALQLRSTPAAQVALANELRETGDLAASAAIARELLPSNEATARYLLGRAINSEAELRRALDLFPRYGAAQFALATLLRRSGQPDAGLLDNYERDKLVVPPFDDPESAAVAALATTPAALLRRAVQEESAGRLSEAAELQRQALIMQPDLVDAWVNLISLNARLNRDGAAEDAYRKAIALAPNRAEAYYNYGVYNVQRQRFAAAAEAFQRTLNAVPRHAEAALNLGGILARQGRFAEAAAMLRRAAESKPDFAQAHFEYGRVLAYQRQTKQAIAELQRAAALASRNGQADLAAVSNEMLRKLQ